MPTLSGAIYPKTKDWDEFENICKDSFELRLDKDLIRHGRQGQKQEGVDIFSADVNINIGIQCKNTISFIDIATIDSECIKASDFYPPLKYLYIATAADRDVTIQKYVRNLNLLRFKEGLFNVEIVFWNDIINDLCKSESAVKKHFPQFFTQSRCVERDEKLLIKYCEIFTHEYQRLLRVEPFGKLVPRKIIDHIVDFYFENKDDPRWQFNDLILEEYRENLMNSIANFQKHFKQQSGGGLEYDYKFVDLSECARYGEKTYKIFEEYVYEMHCLSVNVADNIIKFLLERKNLGL